MTYTPKNTAGVKATEPALFLATQTTIPVLTQMMAGFSLAAVAIAASATWSATIPFLFQPTTREVSLVLISLSVLFFIFATTACIKSQSWDYFAVTEERRNYDNLQDTATYINKCLRERKTWHGIAVRAYRLGVLSIILGAAFLFWPLSRLTSVIIGAYVPTSIILGWVVHRREKKLLERD
jgi:uncharacterized membrane protein YqjE